MKDAYRRNQRRLTSKDINAIRGKYGINQMFLGNVVLSLDKVVDVIRYFAVSTGVTSLYKVKLMKLMWYSDALSYKKRGSAITGLAYQALRSE